MANKPLKSIQFPGLADTYTVPQVDNTLAVTGAAADAKKTGDEITSIKQDLSEIVPGLSDEAKEALLACFEHVAWIDEHGQDYYDALETALHPSEYPKITAVYTPSGIIYNVDDVDSIKQNLVVTYFETESDSGTVLSSSQYSLSGVLQAPSCVITAIYQSVMASFTVSVQDIYNQYQWDYPNGLMALVRGTTERIDTTIKELYIKTQNARCVLGSTKGNYKIKGYDKTTLLDVYPIKIPTGATGVTVSGTTGSGSDEYCLTRVNRVGDLWNLQSWTSYASLGTRFDIATSLAETEYVLILLRNTSFSVTVTSLTLTFDDEEGV